MRRFGGHEFDWNVFADVANELWRVTKPGGILCWQEGEEVIRTGPRKGSYSGLPTAHAMHLQDLGFLRWDRLVTGVTGIRCPDAGKRYLCPPTDLFVLTKGEPRNVALLEDRLNSTVGKHRRTTDRRADGTLRIRKPYGATKAMGRRTTIWLYPAGASTTRDAGVRREFPALMIEALARDLILSYSLPGDLVLDPFAGACTTGKLALLLDRKFVGYEIHEPYFKMGAERLWVAAGAAALARLKRCLA
jgi:site-specific DNA-methyltransferase (adenine-specific)